MRVPQRAREIYRSQGALALLRKAGRSVRNRVERRLRHAYYDRKDSYEVTFGDCRATFPSHTDDGGDVTRATIAGETAFLDAVLGALEPGDVFWDVGANLGVFACLAADAVEDGQIVAVEPNPENAAQLRANLERNGATNATVLQVALANADGTVEFEIPADERFSSRGTLASNDVKETETVDVRQRRLSQVVREDGLSAPTVMKVDIEGAEALAVDGFDGAFGDCRVVFTEVHTSETAAQSIHTYGATLEEYCRRLEALGFENEVLARRGNEVHLKSVRAAE